MCTVQHRFVLAHRTTAERCQSEGVNWSIKLLLLMPSDAEVADDFSKMMQQFVTAKAVSL